jgi:pilus assembly protein CpaB
MIVRLACFGLMSLGLAGFGTVAWVSTRPPPAGRADVSATAKVAVLAFAKPVRAGALLKPEDFAVKETTLAEAGEDASRDTPEARHALTGAMVRASMGQGDIIRRRDVMTPGDHGFLASVLSPGMRSVSISVDAAAGEVDLIWPGDRIDLILTQTVGDAAAPAGRRIASETVLRGVRVIAIDQQIVQGAASGGADGKARNVTMEVTSEQAERISVATHLGRLSIAVRSADQAAPEAAAAVPRTTWASDVSPALRADAPKDTSFTMRVFAGNGAAREFRF